MNFPMKTVILYTDGGQESERIRQLLLSLGDEYLEYTLGTDFTEREFISEFGERAEYPQVTIGFDHIGGLKETLNYLKDRNLI